MQCWFVLHASMGMKEHQVRPELPWNRDDLITWYTMNNQCILQFHWLSRENMVVYCVMTDPAPSQRHDKIGMMTARHRIGPCRYRDGGGKWDNFTVIRGWPRWISHGHVS